MITMDLKLRYAAHPMRETDAWYLAGSDPAQWLEEVSRWQIPHSDIQLWPVPKSNSDLTPAGVLLTLTKGAQSAGVSRRCVPLGQIAGQLYLPVEASLDPDIADTELQASLSSDNIYLWHPTIGLVGFEPEDALGISDLIKLPAPKVGRWDFAQPGVVLASKLNGIIPEVDPTPEMILERGQDGIGEQSGELTDLPPSDLEPKPGMLNEAGRKSTRMFAGMLRWLAQHAPAGSEERTWVNKMEDWAGQKLSKLNEGLNAARNKEISRLMEMLENDPDRGLRFALPLTGDAHRGLAPPNSTLAERPTNFNLNQMGRGGATDFWDLSYDYRARLTTRYRELANREMNLGRHRRAAYIFAELLGDYHAAASALSDGRHWREAAVIYQKKLNRPQDAVRCLEAGGLWNEAITLHIELENFEKAGDLYLRIDQVESAHVQFRSAVSHSQSKGDLLNAARLLEVKLDAPDESLETLTSGWPASSQAEQCLRESFALLARHGRHEDAGRRITELRDGSLPERHRMGLVNIIADTAVEYPDSKVMEIAADSTRVLVARQLKESGKSESRQLLSAIRRLVPADRLLNRDCERYLQQMVIPPAPVKRVEKSTHGKTANRIRTLTLPERHVRWQNAISTDDMILVAGQKGRSLIAARSSFEKTETSTLMWNIDHADTDTKILLAMASQRPDFVLMHPIGGALLNHERKYLETDECRFATTVGAPRGMSWQVLSASGTSQGIIWLLEVRNGELTMIAIGREGQQITSENLQLPEVSDEFADIPFPIPIPLHARFETLYIGWYNLLLIYKKSQPVKTVEFAQPIMSLSGSAPFTLPRIVLSFPNGGSVLWDDFEGEHPVPFGEDLSNPLTCITRHGHLIAVSGEMIEVYDTRGKTVRYESQRSRGISKPIAVLPSARDNQFSIVSENGEIDVYDLD